VLMPRLSRSFRDVRVVWAREGAFTICHFSFFIIFHLSLGTSCSWRFVCFRIAPVLAGQDIH
jgi:hypothetical protein